MIEFVGSLVTNNLYYQSGSYSESPKATGSGKSSRSRGIESVGLSNPRSLC